LKEPKSFQDGRGVVAAQPCPLGVQPGLGLVTFGGQPSTFARHLLFSRDFGPLFGCGPFGPVGQGDTGDRLLAVPCPDGPLVDRHQDRHGGLGGRARDPVA